MIMQPNFLILFLLFSTSAAQSPCHDSIINIGDDKFNVNHLKDHRPPYQIYSDKSNIYGKESSGDNFTLFNLADIVQAQEVDNHKIATRCQPRSNLPSSVSNKPAACAPEKKEHCDENPCWIALGSCDKMEASLIDKDDASKGLRIKYNNGDYQGSSFVITINCCSTGVCLEDQGLDSPAIFKTAAADCPLGATACTEITSPFGCDCKTREAIDKRLSKEEFHCDATPSGLSSGTSTGTLLLIFFFLTVGLYLLIGIGYNYKEGRRGEEMIPHVEMWKDLGGLIYDGFMYVKSCGEYREGVQYDTIG